MMHGHMNLKLHLISLFHQWSTAMLVLPSYCHSHFPRSQIVFPPSQVCVPHYSVDHSQIRI